MEIFLEITGELDFSWQRNSYVSIEKNLSRKIPFSLNNVNVEIGSRSTHVIVTLGRLGEIKHFHYHESKCKTKFNNSFKSI